MLCKCRKWPPCSVFSPIDLIECDTSPSYNEVSYLSHYIYCIICMLPTPWPTKTFLKSSYHPQRSLNYMNIHHVKTSPSKETFVIQPRLEL